MMKMTVSITPKDFLLPFVSRKKMNAAQQELMKLYALGLSGCSIPNKFLSESLDKAVAAGVLVYSENPAKPDIMDYETDEEYVDDLEDEE